jgi:hypothetical protein
MTVSVSSYALSGPNVSGNATVNGFSGPDPVTLTINGNATNSSQGYVGTWTPTSAMPTFSIGTVAPPTVQPGNTRSDNTKCGSCDGGPVIGKMAGYSFQALATCLNISDMPIIYSPPVGPDIGFVLSYNHKEEFQPTNWTFSNLGAKWNLGGLSFIQDDPASPNADVRWFPDGGGSELFTGYSVGTGAYSLSKYIPIALGPTHDRLEMAFNFLFQTKELLISATKPIPVQQGILECIQLLNDGFNHRRILWIGYVSLGVKKRECSKQLRTMLRVLVVKGICLIWGSGENQCGSLTISEKPPDDGAGVRRVFEDVRKLLKLIQ